MIADIELVIRDLVEDEPSAGRTSVIRIQTTNVVYLVFDNTDNSPRWVVRTGSKDNVAHERHVMQRLYSHAPSLVPRSLGSAPWKNDLWIHVQTGLRGVPWFRLQQSVRRADDWLGISHSAAAALRMLHSAILKHEPWCGNLIDLGAELEGQRERTAHDRFTLDLRVVWQRLERSAASLKPLRWHAQHGDFCLNNLLFDGTSARVIDFEEFALTAMPLHDEFGLALSLWDLMPERIGRTVSDHLAFVLYDPICRNPWVLDHLEGFFLHHLCWRLARCTGAPRRSALAARLTQMIQGLTQNWDELFSQTRRKIEARLSYDSFRA